MTLFIGGNAINVPTIDIHALVLLSAIYSGSITSYNLMIKKEHKDMEDNYFSSWISHNRTYKMNGASDACGQV